MSVILERCPHMGHTHAWDLSTMSTTIFVYNYMYLIFNLNHQIFLDDMDIFQNYCVVYERQQTVPQLRIVPFDKPEDQYVVQVIKQFMF